MTTTSIKEVKKELEDFITNVSLDFFEKITTEVLPMKTGFTSQVITHPVFPTIEQAKDALNQLNEIRNITTKKRDELKKKLSLVVEEKINELSLILPKNDPKYKTPRPSKWVTEIKSAATFNDLNTSHFWQYSYHAIECITKWIKERETKITEKAIEDKVKSETEWCKLYLLNQQNSLLTKETLDNLSSKTIIETTHTILKNKFSKENELSGEKCYCDAHDGNRHYHFAETHWDGKEVSVFETSETY